MIKPTSSEKFQEWRETMQPPIPPPWRNLIETITRAAEEVHEFLGPGLARESCVAALAHELSLRSLAVGRDLPVTLRYKGIELPARHLDLVVNELVAIDVRSDNQSGEAEAAQLLGLLRGADLPIGLVIDFGVVKLRNGIYRRLNRAASAALTLLPQPETATDEPHAETA
jgi:GxxExxY protein